MILKGKVAIITGMGPGLGQELAHAFVREGAKVAICSRSEDYLQSQASALEATGAEALAIPTDVTDRAQCDRLVAATLERFGKIDALVNSAYSPGTFGAFEDSNLDDWRLPFEVNVIGSMNMTQAALNALKVAEDAAIVNVNSMIQRKPLPGQAAYAASKGALSAATKALAVELGPFGIRVNSVMMGWMWGAPTAAGLQMMADMQGTTIEAAKASVVENIPLGFMPEDGDCANAIAFFCSPLSRVISGASLDVNGGEFMP